MEKLSVKIKEFKDANEGDLLAFDGKKWVPASVDSVVAELTHRIADLETELKDTRNILNSNIMALQTALNEQREQVVEILKGLVK